MYETQLINLLREFCLVSSQHHSFDKLLNDADYRSHSLATAQSENNNKISILVSQVHAIENLLNQKHNQNLINQTKQQEKKQLFGMVALAFSGLFFITASVIIIEEIKHQRTHNQTHQTD